MLNDIHLVIDLETVSLEDTAGILSIGACTFTAKRLLEEGLFSSTFYVNVDVKSCIDAGMTYDWETIMWWFEQDSAAGKALQNNRVDITWALTDLTRYCTDNEHTHVWGNPSNFDISILEHAYSRIDRQHPWKSHHKKIKDLVTLEGLLTKDKLETTWEYINSLDIPGVKHDALYDAKVAAYRISCALGELL